MVGARLGITGNGLSLKLRDRGKSAVSKGARGWLGGAGGSASASNRDRPPKNNSSTGDGDENIGYRSSGVGGHVGGGVSRSIKDSLLSFQEVRGDQVNWLGSCACAMTFEDGRGENGFSGCHTK